MYNTHLHHHGPQSSHHNQILKVQGVIVTLIAGPTLNVTATIRDKGKKSIRIRKTKESEGTILSVTASQLVCRPSGKHLLTG